MFNFSNIWVKDLWHYNYKFLLIIYKHYTYKIKIMKRLKLHNFNMTIQICPKHKIT